MSDRRVGALTSLGMRPDAAKLMVKSEFRGANGDQTGAREALEQATVLDDRFVPAHLALAGLYERLESGIKQSTDIDRSSRRPPTIRRR